MPDASATLAAARRTAAAFEAHAAACRAYAASVAGARLADDAVQEAFVGLMRHHTAGRDVIADERAWLMTATGRAALNLVRGEARRRHREAEVAVPCVFEPRPGDPLDAGEAARALGDLPARQCRAVTARLWGGLTFDAIARLLDTSVSTAHATYAAAIVALRDRLDAAPLRTPERKLRTPRRDGATTQARPDPELPLQRPDRKTPSPDHERR